MKKYAILLLFTSACAADDVIEPQLPIEPGTLQGRAVWAGPEVSAGQLQIRNVASRECCGGKEVDLTDRSVLVDGQGGLAGTVVTLPMKDAPAFASDKEYVLEIVNGRYEPHVLIVPAGARVRISNSCGCCHNIHTYAARNSSLNRSLQSNDSVEMVLDRPDKVEIRDDIHPWMQAWIYVTDTPVATLTDSDGSFELRNLPAGRHELHWWHPVAGKGQTSVDIREEGRNEIQLSVKKKVRSAASRR